MGCEAMIRNGWWMLALAACRVPESPAPVPKPCWKWRLEELEGQGLGFRRVLPDPGEVLIEPERRQAPVGRTVRIRVRVPGRGGGSYRISSDAQVRGSSMRLRPGEEGWFEMRADSPGTRRFRVEWRPHDVDSSDPSASE